MSAVSALASIVKSMEKDLGVGSISLVIANHNNIIFATDIPADQRDIVASTISFVSKYSSLNEARFRNGDYIIYVTKKGEITLVLILSYYELESILYKLLNKHYLQDIIKASEDMLREIDKASPELSITSDELTEEDILILLDFFKAKLREVESKGG